jgi:hypothetical protein
VTKAEAGIVTDPEEVQGAIASLEELAALETRTLTAEINAFGLLRDRISPAARYGDTIQSKYRRSFYKTEKESEQSEYLSEGFTISGGGKLLTALIVIDNYSTVELQASASAGGAMGQFVGERLYLTRDRKWILAERAGAYSEAPGSTSEWEARCRSVLDRSLLERYSLEVITEGLFAATNRLWEKLSPRREALQKRFDKVNEVAGLLANFTLESPPTLPETSSKSKIW